MKENDSKKFNLFSLVVSVASLIVAIGSCNISNQIKDNEILMHNEVLKISNRPFLYYGGEYGVDFNGFNEGGTKVDYKDVFIFDGENYNTAVIMPTKNRERYYKENGYNIFEMNEDTGVCTFFIPLINIGPGIARNIEVYELPGDKIDDDSYIASIAVHNTSDSMDGSVVYSLVVNKDEKLNTCFMFEFHLVNNSDKVDYLLVYQDLYGNVYSSLLQFRIDLREGGAETSFYYFNTDSNEIIMSRLNNTMVYNIKKIISQVSKGMKIFE